MWPRTSGILESSLYVSDLPRSIRFYQDTFGFSVISERQVTPQFETHKSAMSITAQERRRRHPALSGRPQRRLQQRRCGPHWKSVRLLH